MCIAFKIANELAIKFGGSVKAKRGFNPSIFEVAINGFGATNHLHWFVFGFVVFCQNSSIGVGVIATHNHNCANVEFFDDFEPFVKLFGGFKFGAPRANNVKTTRVAVLVNQVAGEFDIVVVDESAGPHQKAI